MFSQTMKLGPEGSVHDSPESANSGSVPPHALLSAARRCAIRELALAPPCKCGQSLREHMLRSLGSTLFFDDEPQRLWLALDPQDRAFITPRLVAACIVLEGRVRETIFPPQQPPTWPALLLLTAPAAPDLLASIRRLIADTQQRAERDADVRFRRAVAHLWAAADTLEGPSD